jgi:hypothetical protein
VAEGDGVHRPAQLLEDALEMLVRELGFFYCEDALYVRLELWEDVAQAVVELLEDAVLEVG